MSNQLDLTVLLGIESLRKMLVGIGRRLGYIGHIHGLSELS